MDQNPCDKCAVMGNCSANHPVSEFAEQGNGLAVCNVANANANEKVIPVVGLKTTKAASTIQNLILKPDGNVGIGYADAALAMR